MTEKKKAEVKAPSTVLPNVPTVVTPMASAYQKKRPARRHARMDAMPMARVFRTT